MSVRALRDIAEGEELVWQYLGVPFEVRCPFHARLGSALTPFYFSLFLPTAFVYSTNRLYR